MMDKTLIITGSSRGLGKEIAKESSKRKWFYYPFSRWNGVDLLDLKTVDYYFDIIKDNPPLALVNNAGLFKSGGIIETDIDDFKNVIDTNLTGAWYCAKLYAKMCIKNNISGKIINICSTAGLGKRPNYSVYACSKAALINLSLSLSQELRDYGISVYTICPGAFDSDLRHELNPDDDFENMLKPDKVAKFVMDLIETDNFLDNQIIEVKHESIKYISQ
jgi:3-oxoacyl-[acyl-carrier protein] reductase